MSTYQEDVFAIAELMTGWQHRDLAQWDQMRKLFHDDGTIEISWYKGLFSKFVDASMGMGQSDFRTKHMVASPVVTFNGNKAIVETNAIIVGENVVLGLGCVCHDRFYDRAEKRDGVWKLVNRQAIYDMSYFTFPMGLRELDQEVINRYPREYAALAYVLEKSGFPLKVKPITKGSDEEKALKAEAQAWLAS